MIKEMNKKGGEAFVVLIVSVVALILIIGAIFYIRNNVSTWVLNVTPSLATSAQTSCAGGIEGGAINEVCYKMMKIGDSKGSSTYVTCSELNKNPPKYGVIFNADVKAKLDNFFNSATSACPESEINKQVAQECLKFGSGLEKVGVNGVSCSQIIQGEGFTCVAVASVPASKDCSNHNQNLMDCINDVDCEVKLNSVSAKV